MASRNIYFEFFKMSVFTYSHSRTLRNNWPIRSSCGRDDVKLTRVGAILPVEPFLTFARSYDTNVALFDGFKSYFRLGLTHFELTVGQEMEIY